MFRYAFLTATPAVAGAVKAAVLAPDAFAPDVFDGARS
ncbi:hypothetical protein KY5_1030c [Streptomyces formicae]|uniref:Uncharacterized protein n=1 Tax=Streptomyces formicae TaxID=1616117 RepID=A0A291Q3F8_9ACTN|nr:hypothetical protein KY5_1030c [Streptomyces formicae]